MSDLRLLPGGLDDKLPPPHSREAEVEVLGSALMHPGVWVQVSEALPQSSFFVAAHRAIYAGMKLCHERHGDIDPVTLGQALRDSGRIEAAGQGAIGHLLDRIGTTSNLQHYIRIVRDKAAKRRMLAVAEVIRRAGQDDAVEVDEALARAVAEVKALEESTIIDEVDDSARGVAAQLDAIVAASTEARGRGESLGFPFGLAPLDDLFEVWPGDLVTVMGPRAHGKSALALQFALANVRAGRRGVVYSVEMKPVQCLGRIIAGDSGVPYHVQRSGKMSPLDWGLYKASSARVDALPLHFVDATKMTIDRVRLHAKGLVRKHGKLDFVVLDYVQKMRKPDRFPGNETDHLSSISGGMKALAMELDCAAVQLSQPVTAATRKDQGATAVRRPTMADAKGSGSIADDSDGFLVVFRPAMDSLDATRRKSAEISVEKAREGEGAGRVVNCQFNGARMHFEEAPMGPGGP